MTDAFFKHPILNSPDAKEKKNAMDAYWVPGVNHLGQYGRWALAELTDVYQIEADLEAMLEDELGKMIDRITVGNS